MKQLHKFTEITNGRPVYLDLSDLNGLYTVYKNEPTSNFVAINWQNDQTHATVLVIGNMLYYVKEHLSEVLALVEGRDAFPAKILFGKKE